MNETFLIRQIYRAHERETTNIFKYWIIRDDAEAKEIYHANEVFFFIFWKKNLYS